jgi:hypothetical protein
MVGQEAPTSSLSSTHNILTKRGHNRQSQSSRYTSLNWPRAP